LRGVLKARSEAEILERYPELAIISERPAWMTSGELRRSADLPYDIDEAPRGLLEVLLTARGRP
jgi:hypothetical protein